MPGAGTMGATLVSVESGGRTRFSGMLEGGFVLLAALLGVVGARLYVLQIIRHDRVALAARRHGLVIRPLGDSILFVPPISIQADEVKHLVRAVRLAMDEVLPTLKAD